MGRATWMAGVLLATLCLAPAARADEAPPAETPLPEREQVQAAPTLVLPPASPDGMYHAAPDGIVAPCPASCAQPAPTPTCAARWTILLEGAFTHIDSPRDSIGEPVPPGTQALDWGAVEYGIVAPGGRLSVSYRYGDRTRLEVRAGYLGLWDESSFQQGAFGFSPPRGGVSPPLPAWLESEAELCGGELNHWWTVCRQDRMHFDLGLGMRYVRFAETATVASLPLATTGSGAYLSSDVSTELLAAQLSAAATWNAARGVELSLLGKCLLGGATRETEVLDCSVLSGGTHRSTTSATEFGWGIEVEGRALFRITQRVGLTVGAAVLYVDGACRAYDAFDFSQAGTGAVQARDDGNGLLAVTFLMGLQVDF